MKSSDDILEILLIAFLIFMTGYGAGSIMQSKKEKDYDYILNLETDRRMYLINNEGDTIYVSPVDNESPTPLEHAIGLDTL